MLTPPAAAAWPTAAGTGRTHGMLGVTLWVLAPFCTHCSPLSGPPTAGAVEMDSGSFFSVRGQVPMPRGLALTSGSLMRAVASRPCCCHTSSPGAALGEGWAANSLSAEPRPGLVRHSPPVELFGERPRPALSAPYGVPYGSSLIPRHSLLSRAFGGWSFL